MNRETILAQNYQIFLQKEGDIKPRRVRFPEELDLNKGTVKMWVPVIPGTTEQENLQDVEAGTDLTKLTPPAEIETEATLKEEKGQVFIMNLDGSLHQKS